MSALRAVRPHLSYCLGVFPLFHAVTDDYISFGHKNMPLVSATFLSRSNVFDGAKIYILITQSKYFIYFLSFSLSKQKKHPESRSLRGVPMKKKVTLH